MSEERKQVLTMLAEGKVTPDEAERLLEKLGESGGGGASHRHGRGHGHRRLKGLRFGAAALPDGDADPNAEGTAKTPKAALKYLRVEVNSADKDQVSIRVPLQLIRTGVKLTTLLPTDTNAKLAENGIDLNELGSLEGEELIEALRELTVDVESADGDTVRVFCE